MSNQNSSTKKSVNRARKANGKSNKSRPGPRNGLDNRPGNSPAPVSFAREVVVTRPQVGNKNSSKYIVTKRELISIVNSPTTAFAQLRRYRINPASQTTFPWLSKMAALYESYRFHKLHFVAMTKAPTSSAGSLIMSPDYDAADGAIALTEESIFNNEGSLDTPVWKEKSVLVLRPESMNKLYKSHTCMSDDRFALSQQDQKTIDAGQVFICSEGYAGDICKLIVEYTVEFFIPQSPTELAPSGGFQANSFATNNASQVAPFNGNVPVLQSDPIPTLIPTPTSSPTATLGQLVKDFQGVVTNQITGSGISGHGEIYVGKKAGAVDLVNDILQPYMSNGFTVGSTFNQITGHNISGLAGDFVKYLAPVNTTLTHYASFAGGVAPLSVLL